MIKEKRIIIFGGSGSVGTALRQLLDDQGVRYVAPTHSYCDLLNEKSLGNLMEAYRHIDPKDMIWVNLAGQRTNVTTNLKNPVETYTNTITFSLNLFKAAQRYGVGKVISIISSCAYPYKLDVLEEKNIDDGPTHPSISSHGAAKREIVRLSNFYRQQYGMNSSCLVFNNIYGYWRDNDPLHTGTLKVADNLIKKFVLAKKNGTPVVEVFGTGKPLREFLYYKDAAESIVRFIESGSDVDILNIGSRAEATIWDLVYLIRDLTGYAGSVVWLNDKPDGQMKKLLENKRMKDLLNWSPPTTLMMGLIETIEWYENYLKEKNE